MKRREFLALAGAATAFPRMAVAQQPAKLPRIAYLYTRPDLRAPLIEGLAEAGYVDGKTIAIDYSLVGTVADAPGAVAAAIAGQPDVIVALSLPVSLALKASKTAIPVVFADVPDPLLAGLVESLDRPGGTMTGAAGSPPDLIARHFELLREIVPTVRKVAFFAQPTDPRYAASLVQAEATAKAFGAALTVVDVKEGDIFSEAFDRAATARVEGVIFMDTPYFDSNMKALAGEATEWRLPTVGSAEQGRHGALVGLGANVPAGIRAAAKDVDAILKGARPADLPVIQPTKFDLVANDETSRWLGVSLPKSLVGRATEIIK